MSAGSTDRDREDLERRVNLLDLVARFIGPDGAAGRRQDRSRIERDDDPHDIALLRRSGQVDGVMAGELVEFPGSLFGLVLNLEQDNVGVAVLEGDAIRVDTPNGSLGVAGVKGFGGGFAGASGANRNISAVEAITIGSVSINNDTAFNTTLTSGGGNHTFDAAGDGPATILVDGTGGGNLGVSAAMTLNDSLVATVNQTTATSAAGAAAFAGLVGLAAVARIFRGRAGRTEEQPAAEWSPPPVDPAPAATEGRNVKRLNKLADLLVGLTSGRAAGAAPQALAKAAIRRKKKSL